MRKKIDRFSVLTCAAATVLLALAGLLFPQMTSAQKKFTLEDLNFGGTNYRNMIAKNRYATWWGNQLVGQDIEQCSLIDKKTGKATKLFTLAEINKWIGQEKAVASLYYASFPDAKQPLVLVESSKKRYLVNFKKHAVVWVQNADHQAHVDFCPVTRLTAYTPTDGYDLYVAGQEGQQPLRISSDASRNLLYGTSVHRDEFGYEKGTFWSPDGKKLAFTRMDQSMVTDYPLVHIPEIDWKPAQGESRMATPAPEKYPMAGEKMHKVTIGVYDIETGSSIFLKAGDPTDRYFTNPAWSPDSKTVYLFELNRDQNDCRLVAYDAVTGEKRGELYRETDEKYVEPSHPIVFLPWNSNEFLFQSQRDGYNHLYVFNLKTNSFRQLTSGKWVVMEMLGFNVKRHSIVIASNECSPIQRNLYEVNVDNGRSPIQRNLYEVNVDNGRRTLLDNGKGWHRGQLSTDGAFIYDNYSAPDVPRNIDIIDVAKAQRFQYFSAENPWNGYDVPKYECGTIKAADGKTDLYWRMVKPVSQLRSQ